MKGPFILTSRRALLRGVAGSSFGIGLTGWLRTSISRAEGEAAPKRLVLVHRPNGTIRSQWLNGAGSDASWGPILEPFEGVRGYAVVPDGLESKPSNGGFDSHEGGMVTFMTLAGVGAPRPPSNDDYRNTAMSADLRLGATSEVLSGAPVNNVQLAAHNTQDGAPELANLTTTYSGPDEPILPVTKPSLAYAALIGSLAPGQTPQDLQRLRAKRQSVLSFIKSDLARVRNVAPASQRELFDSHENAIRELELGLDAAACEADGEAPADPPVDTHWFEDVAAVGAAHHAIVRTAFSCDLTRLVSFMWSAGASRVSFADLYDGMGTVHHHGRSHESLDAQHVQQSLAAIDRWYSQRTATFLEMLRDTPDIDGTSLLDNTLVVYFSEVAAGNHSFGPLPIVLFGGPGVGLQGDRVLDYQGRSTADLWLAIAEMLGGDLGAIDVPSDGPLPGLFT